MNLADLLNHIERIYDFKTRFYDYALPSSSSSLSRSAGYERGAEKSTTPSLGAGSSSSSSFLYSCSAYRGASLADAWLDFETEEFGLRSQGEMKVCRILHTILNWQKKNTKKSTSSITVEKKKKNSGSLYRPSLRRSRNIGEERKEFGKTKEEEKRDEEKETDKAPDKEDEEQKEGEEENEEDGENDVLPEEVRLFTR